MQTLGECFVAERAERWDSLQLTILGTCRYFAGKALERTQQLSSGVEPMMSECMRSWSTD